MSTTIERMLRELVSSGKKLPTPLYIVNREVLERNVDDLYAAFNSVFRKFIFGYSYKTNYATGILRLIHDKGGYAEVVSPMELQHALRLVPAQKVIYNGVIPDMEGKFYVARNGGIVNVENLTELENLNRLARKDGRILELGIRVNLKLDGAALSRFGIEVDDDAVKAIEHLDHIRIVGIHCHITKSRALTFWRQKAEQMGQIAKRLGVRYIDFGGNMYGPMNPKLVAQFDSAIPTFQEYADCIHEELAKFFSDEEMPVVIVEAGTPIISNAQSYLTSVVCIKRVAGKPVVTLDGKRLDITVIGDSGKTFPMYVVCCEYARKYMNAEMYGCTCLEFDKLASGYTGPLAVGDMVLFDNVGSYSNVLAPRFIQAVPGMAIYADRHFELIKTDDSMETVFGEYK